MTETQTPTWAFGLITLGKGLAVLVGLLTAAAYLTWLERRLLARFQLRLGPNRVGPFGLLQPLADGLKLMMKETFLPQEADRAVFLIAPALSMLAALLAFAVIPFGPPLELWGVKLFQIADPDVGILFVLAVSSLGVYGVILGGWASASKYSLLGGLRSSAQMISYELAVGLAIVGVILLSGTLRLSEIVAQQAEGVWNVFLQPLGFLLFVIGGIAETNRAPFDLPEAEHELVGGFHTEYAGMRFASFFVAEYGHMVVMASVATTLFLGGWDGPFVEQAPLLGLLWFALKVFAFMFLFIWLRATLPRVRYDQLMSLGWKVLIPLALLNLTLTAAGVAALGAS